MRVVACTDTDTRYKILDTGYKIIDTDEVTYTFKQTRTLYRFRYRLLYRFLYGFLYRFPYRILHQNT